MLKNIFLSRERIEALPDAELKQRSRNYKLFVILPFLLLGGAYMILLNQDVVLDSARGVFLVLLLLFLPFLFQSNLIHREYFRRKREQEGF